MCRIYGHFSSTASQAELDAVALLLHIGREERLATAEYESPGIAAVDEPQPRLPAGERVDWQGGSFVWSTPATSG